MKQKPRIAGILFRALFSLVVSVILIFTLLPAAEINAQSGELAVVSPSSSDITVGETVSIDVELSGGVDINGFDITISYDPAIVSLESWAPGSYLSNLAPVYQNKTDGSLQLVYVQLDTEGANGDGTLISFSFKGLAAGSSSINLDSVILADKSSEKIYPSAQNGIINVVPAAISTATNTLTSSPTVTNTATFTNTPSSTSTLTRTPVLVNKTATKTPTKKPVVVAKTSTPTNTLTATLSLTASPLAVTATPLEKSTDTPNSDVVELTATNSNPSLPQTGPTAVSGSEFKLKFINQMLCVVSLLLILILLALILLILRRRRKKNESKGD